MTPTLQFFKDRQEALLSLDREKILTYLEKYGEKAPENEEVFWAGIHKARVHCLDLPSSAQDESRKWLREHGFSEKVGP